MNDIRQALISLGAKLSSDKMVWGSAGNISMRTDSGIAISASGTNLGALLEDDITFCGLEGSYQGKKPSKELPLHLAIYKNCPNAGAVIHATPFYATMAACSNLKLEADLFVESMYYLERMAQIPFENPGSEVLADLVDTASKRANVILMRNHGVLVYDSNVKEALTTLEILETVCRMNVEASKSGIVLGPPKPEKVKDFLDNSGYKPRRQWISD
jgi:L-fuculose-phosphate aldolase